MTADCLEHNRVPMPVIAAVPAVVSLAEQINTASGISCTALSLDVFFSDLY